VCEIQLQRKVSNFSIVRAASTMAFEEMLAKAQLLWSNREETLLLLRQDFESRRWPQIKQSFQNLKQTLHEEYEVRGWLSFMRIMVLIVLPMLTLVQFTRGEIELYQYQTMIFPPDTPPVPSSVVSSSLSSRIQQQQQQQEEESIGKSPHHALFYNIFVPFTEEGQENALRIIREQIDQIKHSYAATAGDELVVFYVTLGMEGIVTQEVVSEFCGETLSCRHVEHFIDGREGTNYLKHYLHSRRFIRYPYRMN
jgi:hypothetical protein